MIAGAPRLAVVQPLMRWTIEGNLEAMRWAIAQAARAGATFCVFPELAVTGFHRRVPELAWWGIVEPAVQALRAEAVSRGVALSFGAPTFGPQGARYNSQCFIDARGAVVATVSKVGLTPAEATFFTPGRGRPVAVLDGRRTTAVICREIEDHAELTATLRDTPADLLCWPGLMGPDPSHPAREPALHIEQAQRLARDTGAWIVQANWPNALNDPRSSAGTGHSACIAPDGAMRFRLPVQGCGVAVFALGDADYAWYAAPPG